FTRSWLNTSANSTLASLLSVGAPTPAAGGSVTESLTVGGDTKGSGWYTLKYRYQETRPLPFGAAKDDIQAALRQLSLLGSAVSVDGSAGSYTVTFSSALSNVGQLVAQVIPLVIDGGAGNEDLRVGSVFEQTYFKGGSEPGADVLGADGD